MGLEEIIPSVALILVLVLVLPAFINSNLKRKVFFKNLSTSHLSRSIRTTRQGHCIESPTLTTTPLTKPSPIRKPNRIISTTLLTRIPSSLHSTLTIRIKPILVLITFNYLIFTITKISQQILQKLALNHTSSLRANKIWSFFSRIHLLALPFQVNIWV